MNFSIIFIDDEAWALKGIRNVINWDLVGFEIVGLFDDSVEAMDFIENHVPDVAIVDIRMPDKNGLELMKDANERGLPTVFVIASGFRDFAYAQEAMNLGAFAYILKPLETDQVQKMAQHLHSHLMTSRTNVTEKLMRSIKHDTERYYYEDELTDIWMHTLLVHACLQPYRIILFQVAANYSNIVDTIKELSSNATCLVGKNRYLAIFDPVVDIRCVRAAFESDPTAVAGISKVTKDKSEFSKAFRQAHIASLTRFISSQPGIREYQESNLRAVMELVEQFKNALLESDLIRIKKALENMIQDAKHDIFSIEDIAIFYNQVIALLVYRFENDTIHEFSFMDFLQLSNRFYDLGSFCDEIYDLIKQILSKGHNKGGSDLISTDQQAILNYINANFNTSLYLGKLAKVFSISLSHLSRMIKKSTGFTFTKYVQFLRMSRAARMLKSTDLSILEVAEAVGIEDYFYFCRIFKLTYGTTPTKYKKGSVICDQA